ncbi:MAG: zinc ribbon domain-containing protein [Ktedonobacteraceae bacterium]|nr:zinc ribbon domain-containing protein [Ktedonobacteraceae bacterium]
MKRRNHSTTPSSQPQYFTYPCPKCHRIIRVGDRFCGFCQELLQVQCSHCGRWTKANHTVCPGCGTDLHRGRLTFEEQTRLQALRQQAQALQRVWMENQHHLDVLGRTRKRALSRMLGVGLLTIVAIVVLIMLMSHLSLVWFMVILVMIVLCRRQIPGLVQAYARCYAFPWSQIQQEMDEVHQVLFSLKADIQQIEDEMTPLEAQTIDIIGAQLERMEEEKEEIQKDDHHVDEQ